MTERGPEAKVFSMWLISKARARHKSEWVRSPTCTIKDEDDEAEGRFFPTRRVKSQLPWGEAPSKTISTDLDWCSEVSRPRRVSVPVVTTLRFALGMEVTPEGSFSSTKPTTTRRSHFSDKGNSCELL